MNDLENVKFSFSSCLKLSYSVEEISTILRIPLTKIDLMRKELDDQNKIQIYALPVVWKSWEKIIDRSFEFLKKKPKKTPANYSRLSLNFTLYFAPFNCLLHTKVFQSIFCRFSFHWILYDSLIFFCFGTSSMCCSEKISTKHQNRNSEQIVQKKNNNNINILLFFFWTTSMLYTAACLIVTNHNNA